MPRIKELNSQFVEFLTKHYSDNSNELLAENLTIIANADVSDGKECKITERNVRYYAKKLGLKKSKEYQHALACNNSISDRIRHIGDNFIFYSGRPADDVRKVDSQRDLLIICASKKQMQCIKNAAYRYNSREYAKSGIRLKVSCDADRFSVLLIPKAISLPDSCKTHFSPSESRCAPP